MDKTGIMGRGNVWKEEAVRTRVDERRQEGRESGSVEERNRKTGKTRENIRQWGKKV